MSSVSQDTKKALIYATIGGIIAATAYNSFVYATVSAEAEQSKANKAGLIQQLMKEVRKELEQKYPNGPTRGPGNRILSKQFFMDIQLILYRYQKLAQEVISEKNFQERMKIK